MKILPLSTENLSKILEFNLSYDQILPKFYEVLNDKNDFGSRWYVNCVQKMIDDLKEI